MASIKLKGDTSIYWIRLPEHKDFLSEGYIGISNNVNYRLKQHKNYATNAHLANAIKKYGWDNLIKEVVLIANESYCLMMEKIIRAKENIGWNIAIGGGKPPAHKGGVPLSQETKDKISKAKTGVKLTGDNLKRARQQIVESGKKTRFVKGMKMSKEMKNKSAKARIGRIVSEETKDKIRQKRLVYWQKIKGQN